MDGAVVFTQNSAREYTAEEAINMSEQPKVPLPFHKRFDIEINDEQAESHFVSRILNLIEVNFPGLQTHYINRGEKDGRILKLIATELGIRCDNEYLFSTYVQDDFVKLLHALEALYNILELLKEGSGTRVEMLVETAILKSEIDLGIEWKGGIFKKAGAKLLDEGLVNEPLQWLDDPKYKNVLNPFKKGLSDYMEIQRNPKRLSDTVTDMYEALESMAKIVTGRDDDLSGNRESFITKLKLSNYYKKMLKDYIGYACEYRHGVKPGKQRELPKPNEVEAFIYTTGLFIRLAIQQLDTQK